MSTNVGSIHYDLGLDTKNFDAASQAVGAKVNSLGGKFKSFGNTIGNSALKASAGIAGITAVFSPFFDDAVKRVDTLNNFPKVMGNMGIRAEEASKASKVLVDKLQGLPTTLDNATLAVQRLTTKTQDVQKSTDIFLALNNAVLAGGAPMELQTGATEQFAQAFAKGKPDMMEWRSMLAAMPAQLQQVGTSMGFVDVDAFGAALREGDVTMQEFGNELIKLNSKGVGGLPTLEEQARNATSGIGTAFTNMKTAITRGLANLVQKIGASKIADKINDIGKTIEKVFKFIGDNIEPIAVFVGVILTAAFTKLAIAVVAATLPIVAIAAAFTGLFLLYQRYKPQIDAVTSAFHYFLAPAISYVTEKVKELWSLFQTYLLPILKFVAAVIVEQLKVAWDELVKTFDIVKKTLEPFMPQLTMLAKILGVIIVGSILATIAIIVALVATFATLIRIVATVIRWFSAFVSAVINTARSLYSAIVSIRNRVFGIIGSWASFAWRHGTAFIQGFIDGIKYMANRAVETVKSLLRRVRNLLPFSPAKEGPFSGKGWTMYSGQSIMDGLARGIERSADKPRQAMLNALNGFNPMGDMLLNGVGGGSAVTTNFNAPINVNREVDANRVMSILAREQSLANRGVIPR